ncbi:MAG: cobyric acid synthase [Planktomarina sp.]
MTKAIMIQGAGSNVGKSLVVAGICRALVRRGYRVAPFKPQNMSNNAAVTEDGGEIGRAQALQAMACNLQPRIDMNPVLLKPESETGAQVVVQGKRLTTVKAREYAALKPTLMPKVLESFYRLAQDVDFVIVEGAGSPAEVNLRQGDIANMGFASAAKVPVILLGDIDRGGVIAQMVGTSAVLPDDDRALIKGFAINKFRGDVTLFNDGMTTITEKTGWSPLGVIPWFADAWKLPAEDVMDIATRAGGQVKIAVPKLSRIANFDDLDPLVAEPNVTVDIVEPGRALPGDAELIILPGSKSTIADLADLRAQGWDIDLMAHRRRGGKILGICGGYQMLGQEIHDPQGIEGPAQSVPGLGFLNIITTMTPKKHLTKTSAKVIETGTTVSGYEIHIGETSGSDCDRAWLNLDGRSEGAISADGLTRGCYLHGLFSSDQFRAEFLETLGTRTQGGSYIQSVSETLDSFAEFTETHLDVSALMDLADPIRPS